MLNHVPPPAQKRMALRVSPQAERALRGGHPWLYADSVREISHQGKSGDLAVIFDSKRKFLAIGLYDPHSPIRVRLLQHRSPKKIGGSFFGARLKDAAKIREAIPDATTGYRLVHGENDRFPGLVIDRYDQTLVVKLYTTAWIPHLQSVLSALSGIIPFERIVLRLGRECGKHRGDLHGLEDGQILFGERLDSPVLFHENGIKFETEPILGHKTGFYLDQRENRARVEKLSGGRSVLNLFAYTGGFSLYAARGGASDVTSVDVSEPALQAAERNFALNLDQPQIGACHHETLALDAFEALNQFAAQKRQFDLVILDPPSFAKSQAQTKSALAAYGRLTRLGLRALKPGRVLVQASCSSRVSAEEFYEVIRVNARESGRPLREIERTGHPVDHPVGFEEGAYLKCLFATG